MKKILLTLSVLVALSACGGQAEEQPVSAQPQEQAQSEIHINLEVLLNGNSRASIEAQSLMQEQAEEIIDDETVNQGFSITTQQGEVIQPSDVKLSKSVRIGRYDEANSLLPDSAFTAISEYFLELQSRNLTEQ